MQTYSSQSHSGRWSIKRLNFNYIARFFYHSLFFFSNLYTTHEFNTCPFQFENVTTLCYGYGSGSDHEGHHQTHFFEFCLRAYSSNCFTWDV